MRNPTPKNQRQEFPTPETLTMWNKSYAGRIMRELFLQEADVATTRTRADWGEVYFPHFKQMATDYDRYVYLDRLANGKAQITLTREAISGRILIKN